MQVCYVYPMGDEGWEEHVESPAVPRQGDYVVSQDDEQYVVKYVAWHPWGLEEDGNRTNNPMCRVLVVLGKQVVPMGYANKTFLAHGGRGNG
jgi:hypothetical protein